MTKEKLSPPNQKVYDLLISSTEPMTAYAILGKLRVKGVHSPPTVYRALDKLQMMGLVHRVESLGAFVACRCQKHAHEQEDFSPFAVCTSCGHVQEINDPTLVRVLKNAANGFLVQVQHKVLEISGLCKKCSSKSKGRRACSP